MVGSKVKLCYSHFHFHRLSLLIQNQLWNKHVPFVCHTEDLSTRASQGPGTPDRKPRHVTSSQVMAEGTSCFSEGLSHIWAFETQLGAPEGPIPTGWSSWSQMVMKSQLTPALGSAEQGSYTWRNNSCKD